MISNLPNLYALVFLVINYVPGSVDVATITSISKDPYMSRTLEECEIKKEAIFSQTKQKNLRAVCFEVER